MHRPVSSILQGNRSRLLRADKQHLHSAVDIKASNLRPATRSKTCHPSYICVQSSGDRIAAQAREKFKSRLHKEGSPHSSLSGHPAVARNAQHRSQGSSSSSKGHAPIVGQSKRQFLLASVNLGVLAEISIGGNDPSTILNSVLGAYGLPKVKGPAGLKLIDNIEEGWAFQYPRGWVLRNNSLRSGTYVADFNTSDKAVLEEFTVADGSSLVDEVVRRFVNPGQDVGGDSRLQIPDARRIKSETAEIDGQMYTYVTFPSETTTRSGYQIRRKNFGVAALQKGRVFSLVASARSDQYNPEKEALLRAIVDSFRLRK